MKPFRASLGGSPSLVTSFDIRNLGEFKSLRVFAPSDDRDDPVDVRPDCRDSLDFGRVAIHTTSLVIPGAIDSRAVTVGIPSVPRSSRTGLGTASDLTRREASLCEARR